MALLMSFFIIAVCLIMSGVDAREAYGIETVDNVCAGVGDLDQLGDITSQLMSRRYPEMGSIRVSCTKEQMNDTLAG